MSQPKLTVENVSVVYRNPVTKRSTVALLEISLEIHDGELISLIGPSGCGKSTLLNCISGLIEPIGRITLNGQAICGPGPDRSMVFQSPALFPWRTVLQNVLYGLELRRTPAREAHERALQVLQLVGLDHSVHNCYPHELSGGMQQRVNLARALVLTPEVLLLDEPFASLDAQSREFMQVELLRIWQQSRNTAVFVTHQISEALYLADRVVVMTAAPGRIREVIPVGLPRPRPLRLKREPQFLELENHLWSLIEDEVRAAGLFAIPPRDEGESTAGRTSHAV